MTTGTEETADYIVAKVQDALATDERVGELELDVKVAGRRIFLSGTVATEERRDAISSVVREICPGYEISNEVSVVGDPQPGPEEGLT